MPKPHPSDQPPSVRALTLALLALLALLGFNVAVALGPLPFHRPWLTLSIAVIMAAIVLGIFMRLLHTSGIVRLAAVAGFAWLALLGGLTGVDYATRREVAVVEPAVPTGRSAPSAEAPLPSRRPDLPIEVPVPAQRP